VVSKPPPPKRKPRTLAFEGFLLPF
jgi:hypothetical protein